MLSSVLVVCLIFVATVSAFNAPVTVSTRPVRMTMLFDFFKKKAVVTKVDEKFKPLTGSANKGQYIPEGLTKEQYAKFAKDVADKKAKNSKKFYLGKKAETLTEWMLAEEKKGNVGKGLLSNHRLVKCKYEGWYTDESPV